MRRRRIFIGLALLAALALMLVATAWATGVVTVETHRGFFAPVWDPSGETVYFIQRDTSGFSWGPGWEHFTPPAAAYVTEDAITLRRLDPETGETTILGMWDTPVLGRRIKEYRGRIFNTMRARVDSDDQGVDYRVRMSIPQVPRSRTYELRGRWSIGGAATGEWKPDPGGGLSYGNNVLIGGTEVLTVRGRESFPAAIVATANNRDHEILLRNDEFDSLYPEGIPPRILEERSRRRFIEKARRIRRVRAELIDELRAAGLSMADAELEAIHRMEDMGLYRKGPRMIAREIDEAGPQEPVFEISDHEFLVGLFPDIERAISSPGSEIRNPSRKYVIHRDFDTSRRLNAWLAEHDVFTVRARGKLYRIEIVRTP